MNDYRINLIDCNGIKQVDHIHARTSQEAADQIRKDWPGCYIQRICITVQDWH